MPVDSAGSAASAITCSSAVNASCHCFFAAARCFACPIALKNSPASIPSSARHFANAKLVHEIEGSEGGWRASASDRVSRHLEIRDASPQS